MDIQNFNEGISYTQAQISDMAVGLLGRYLPSSANVGQEATFDAAFRACLTYFESSRHSFLSEHTWSFALKEDMLSEFIPKEEDMPRLAGGHLIPADCISVIAVGRRCDINCGRFINEGHTIRENLIFPCCGKMIRYVYDNTLYYQWRGKPIEAFVLLLCRNIAGRINIDPTLSLYRAINESYIEALSVAKAEDSYTRDITVVNERRPVRTSRSRLLWRR